MTPALYVRGYGLLQLADAPIEVFFRRLAAIPRFCGDTPEWSVLHHSFYVAALYPHRGVEGLLHDVAEAWGYNDVSSPCKTLEQRRAERSCLAEILRLHFPHTPRISHWVHNADGWALNDEKDHFFDGNGRFYPEITRLLATDRGALIAAAVRFARDNDNAGLAAFQEAL